MIKEDLKFISLCVAFALCIVYMMAQIVVMGRAERQCRAHGYLSGTITWKLEGYCIGDASEEIRRQWERNTRRTYLKDLQ